MLAQILTFVVFTALVQAAVATERFVDMDDKTYPPSEIDVRRFGAKCDGVADDALAINSALEYARNTKSTGFVVLPAGTCRVTNTVHMAREPFQSTKLKGQGKAMIANSLHVAHPSSQLGNGTVIWCDFVDKPCVNISYGRWVELADVTLAGNNFGAFPWKAPTSDDEDYVFNGAYNRTQAPYCGICVDPYVGLNPGPGNSYADDLYSALPGGTSNVSVHNVGIFHFVVGVMLSPTTAAKQGDTITVDKSDISGALVCFASGQSQNRAVYLSHSSAGFCKTVVDTRTYGNHDGSNPKLTSVSMGPSYRLFNVGTGPGSTLVIENSYAESIRSLGIVLGTTSGFNGLLVTGSTFGIAGDDIFSGYGEPFLLESAPSATFISSNIYAAGHNHPIFNFPGPGVSSVSFMGSSVFTYNDAITSWIGYNFPLSGGPAILWSNSSSRDNHNTIVRSDHYLARSDLSHMGPRLYAGAQQFGLSDKSGNYLYAPSAFGGYYLADASNITIAGREIEWLATNASEILIGDVFMWLIKPQRDGIYDGVFPACQVTSNKSGRVTCRMSFDPRRYDTVAKMASKAGPNKMVMAVQEWAPLTAFHCDTHQDNRLTNCSPTNITKNGDFIKANTDIAPATRIIAGAGSSTLTLSKNATGSGVGRKIYFGKVVVPSVIDKF